MLHVFALVGADGVGNVVQIVVIVAFKQAGIDVVAAAGADEHLGFADLLQRLGQVHHQMAQVVLLLLVAGLVLPQPGADLAGGDPRAVAVHQEGEQLLGLAALEDQGLAAEEYLKIAEAVHHQLLAGLGPGHGIAQVFQLHPDGILAGRLGKIPAGVERVGGHGVVQIPSDEDQVGLGVALLQALAQLDAVHAAQLNVQEGDVAGVCGGPLQGGGGVGEIRHLGLGNDGPDVLGQQVQRVGLVVNGQDIHDDCPPSCGW